MTAKERKDYNQMKRALARIKMYQSTNALRRDSVKDWGLDYEDALEMAYENVLNEAKQGLKGVKNLKEETK